MDFGFSHAYHLPLSVFPFSSHSLEDRLDRFFRLMKQAGAKSYRPHIPWNSVERFVENPCLKRNDVTDAMIDDYIAGSEYISWDETDMVFDKMIGNGISPHMCLAVGYYSQLPLFERTGFKNKYLKRGVVRFDPANIKEDIYLGHLFLHVRAVVRKYKQICNRWQLENELNGAMAHKLLGWREGLAWGRNSFKQAVITTIHDAVKLEQPDAICSHNFMMPTGNKEIPVIGMYKKHVKAWEPLLDIIGIDPYPNHFDGEPISIRPAINCFVNNIRELGIQKPIYVMETGYPVRPVSRGFSEENQLAYYKETIETAKEVGLDGLYFYSFTSMEGAPGHEWCRMKTDVQDWWGLIRKDDTARPAFEYLSDLAKNGGDLIGPIV